KTALTEDRLQKTPGRAIHLLPILHLQVIDVVTVGLRQSSASNEENVLGVELGAAGEIVRAGDYGVVDDENLVVHEIVAPGRGVRRGIFPDEAGAGDDLLQRADF